MKINKFINKVVLYGLISSGLLWLGSYITRILLTFQLFEETDFQLKSYINQSNLSAVFTTINPAVTLNLFLFPLFLIFFSLYVVTSKLKLKENGWLFISLVIIVLTAPFEAYLLTIDYKIVTTVFYNPNFDSNFVLNLNIERIKLFSSFPIIEILCYFAVIYLFTFKPLTKTTSL